MSNPHKPWLAAILLAIVAHAAVLQLPMPVLDPLPTLKPGMSVTITASSPDGDQAATAAAQSKVPPQRALQQAVQHARPRPPSQQADQPPRSTNSVAVPPAPPRPSTAPKPHTNNRPEPRTRPTNSAVVEPSAPSPTTKSTLAEAPSLAQPNQTPALATAIAPETAQAGPALADRDRAHARYQADLRAHIYPNLRYPVMAKRQRQQGEVLVVFTVEPDGRVSDVRLAQASPFPLLNREALDVIERATPLPPLPPALHGENNEWLVPITFSLL
ncbi:energy transducer TonB [Marinobacter caseinilyticus]|uniref:energy transducer TonB n=1 Tax=Marinobacter caseinilyticus TaxID=2692195 RepID=UPI00140AA1C7|nr:energy transducer TonB [Marinobacter caseinilyticus]